jgi:myosin heavy subunit
MSWEHRGRTYRNHSEYQRAVSESEAEDVGRMNASLQNEAHRLRSELSTTREALSHAQNDLRESVRLQTRLEQKQREYEAIQKQMQQRQQEFETKTKQREQELVREIQDTGQRAEEKIREMKSETERCVVQAREEVQQVREEMNEGFNEVQAEAQQTKRELEDKVKAVSDDLEEERLRRVKKETSRASQAANIIEWIESRLDSLQDIDSLGLTLETIRIRENINRAREMLGGEDREMALPIADIAFTTYRTVHLEIERRIGVINGAAEHVRDIADAMERIAADEMLREIFPVEAGQVDIAAEVLKARADDWRTQRRWTVFETERDRVVDAANQFLMRSLELESLVPGLVKRLEAREERLDQVGEVVKTIAGAADSVELGYANSEDVKSPRLARARIGRACVDVYIELDGNYRVDAYGFDSPLQCSEAAARAQRKLSEKWMVSEETVDPANRQQPTVRAAPAAESWQAISSDLNRMNKDIGDISKK